MGNGRSNTVWREVARVFRDGTLTGLTDRQLLERFADSRDEWAFDLLLSRHGPMVKNVCRQILRNPDDVEDAFQAVFLVLVRKAGSIRVEDSLGPWLYAVAGRTAAQRSRQSPPPRRPRTVWDRRSRTGLGARCRRIRHRPGDPRGAGTLAWAAARSFASVLLRRTDSRARCWSAQVSRGHRAQPPSPRQGAFATAARGRGLAIPVAGVAAILNANATGAVVSPHLRGPLIKMAGRLLAESATVPGGIPLSASVASLLEGVLSMMRIEKLAIVAAACLSVGALVSVVGAAAFSGDGQSGERPVARPASQAERVPAPQPEARTDMFTRTYYVGDILGVDVTGRDPADEEHKLVNVDPLIKLITSTVAPGTWQTLDVSGQATSVLPTRGKIPDSRALEAVRTSPGRTITPFYLSLSLIVKGEAEIHEQLAVFMKGLRDLIFARDRRTSVPANYESRKSHERSPGKPKAATTNPVAAESLRKVQQLVDELNQEMKKLGAEPPHNTPSDLDAVPR